MTFMQQFEEISGEFDVRVENGMFELYRQGVVVNTEELLQSMPLSSDIWDALAEAHEMKACIKRLGAEIDARAAQLNLEEVKHQADVDHLSDLGMQGEVTLHQTTDTLLPVLEQSYTKLVDAFVMQCSLIVELLRTNQRANVIDNEYASMRGGFESELIEVTDQNVWLEALLEEADDRFADLLEKFGLDYLEMNEWCEDLTIEGLELNAELDERRKAAVDTQLFFEWLVDNRSLVLGDIGGKSRKREATIGELFRRYLRDVTPAAEYIELYETSDEATQDDSDSSDEEE